jgi:RND family efflux transporter MFP subunit
VDPGNLVNADLTSLTTIVTENPLYAYFDVDERTFLDLMGSPTSRSGLAAVESRDPNLAVAAAVGLLGSPLDLPAACAVVPSRVFPVVMRLANEDEFSKLGIVNFIDNRVNASTGTIRIRGVFDNTSGSLKPGLFVRIRLPTGAPYEPLLVPDEAVQSDQGRKYVYVVNGDDKVEYRSVTLGQSIQGLRVIKEGLNKGERVIVSGMQRVRRDMAVQTKRQEPPRPPRSPLVELLTARRSNPVQAAGQRAGR